MKPHIRKIKETRYWVCDGAMGGSPWAAYQGWLSRERCRAKHREKLYREKMQHEYRRRKS